MFYSKSTNGFYAEDFHGHRRLTIADPSWTCPPDDPDATPDTIEINNPDCKIPTDAVEITNEEHAALLAGQSQGKRIDADADGKPVLVDPPTPTLEELKTSAQTAIDGYFEELYQRSVANTAIGAEYDAAYMVAKEWLKDTTLAAPERIKALAEMYGCTDEQAAALVIQKWTEAQATAFDLCGAARLRAKTAIRAAADADGVAAALEAGKAAMEAVVFTV